MRWVILLHLSILCGLLTAPIQAQEWWEMETALEKGGMLHLDGKPWWGQAQQLKVGEELVLQSEYPNGGTMLIRREARTRGGKSKEMLVWILDDDGDMKKNSPEGDKDSDCYVADYDVDGTVDQMVDFIDVDGDNDPDEMGIRYFVDGELRNCWFGTDIDDDSDMWDIADYRYTGDFFQSDPYGNSEIYMNKYDPIQHRWLPISECPFAFFDTDADGESEITVRFSGAPLVFSKESDPDYANSIRRYQGEFDPAMNTMGVVNIRYSIDIDGQSSPENPLHYEMGFTMTGSLPYEFEGMLRHQPLRRSPKVSVCIPHDQVFETSNSYFAEQTGFTWREFADTSLNIGHPSRPEYDRRWEGVFWTWQRRILHNTGGPVQDWNSRREFLPTPSDSRVLYYSPVDRRIHLKGATEGWIQIGNIVGDAKLGEIRMYDTNHDGYFDRWEYYDAGEAAPYRVASVQDVENPEFGDDWEALRAFYMGEVLPSAIAQNQSLIEAIEGYPNAFQAIVPKELVQALEENISLDEHRYILDLIREIRFRQFRTQAREFAQAHLAEIPPKDSRADPNLRKETSRTWQLVMDVAELDWLYDRGAYYETAMRINALRSRLTE